MIGSREENPSLVSKLTTEKPGQVSEDNVIPNSHKSGTHVEDEKNISKNTTDHSSNSQYGHKTPVGHVTEHIKSIETNLRGEQKVSDRIEDEDSDNKSQFESKKSGQESERDHKSLIHDPERKPLGKDRQVVLVEHLTLSDLSTDENGTLQKSSQGKKISGDVISLRKPFCPTTPSIEVETNGVGEQSSPKSMTNVGESFGLETTSTTPLKNLKSCESQTVAELDSSYYNSTTPGSSTGNLDIDSLDVRTPESLSPGDARNVIREAMFNSFSDQNLDLGSLSVATLEISEDSSVQQLSVPGGITYVTTDNVTTAGIRECFTNGYLDSNVYADEGTNVPLPLVEFIQRHRLQQVTDSNKSTIKWKDLE